MIRIEIKEVRTIWDQDNERFVDITPGTLELEHNLLAISKWEAKWAQAFLGPKQKTKEMELDYVRCMDRNPSLHHPLAYRALTNRELNVIFDYIQSPHSATGFHKKINDGSHSSRDVVTSELIYYWITQYGIDWRVEEWHLNRLLRLIKVFEVKQPKPPKMPSISGNHYRGRRR